MASQGYLIDHPAIEMSNRKEVGVIKFHKLRDIEEDLIRSLLLEALLIDNET